MQQSQASQADSDDFSPDEEIIREVSPESSSVQRKKPSLLKNEDRSLAQPADAASAHPTDSSAQRTDPTLFPHHADAALHQRPSVHRRDSPARRRRRSSVQNMDTREHKSECRCDCHLSMKKSNKSYVIVPIKQNGNDLKVVRLPIYKMDKEPNKTLFTHTKCKIVPNDPNRYEIISIPMWSVNQSEIKAHVNCKEFEKPNLPSHSDAQCQTDEVEIYGKVDPAALVPPAVNIAPTVMLPPALVLPQPHEEPRRMSAEALPTSSKEKTKMPAKSSLRRKSSDSRQKASNSKWQSLFLNDKSYTRKRSDG